MEKVLKTELSGMFTGIRQATTKQDFDEIYEEVTYRLTKIIDSEDFTTVYQTLTLIRDGLFSPQPALIYGSGEKCGASGHLKVALSR